MKFKTLLLLALFFATTNAQAQKDEYKVACIGFYNFENLFDTIDSPNTIDEEFLPSGINLWTLRNYKEKQQNMAKVVSEMATDVSPDGVALLGLAEIENRYVLEDFVKEPAVAKRNYQIVHYDSPDRRGVDVALLYNPKYFKLTSSKSIPLMIYEAGSQKTKRIYTRDLLLVSGLLDGDPIHVMVNHWPSRRGGEAATAPLRNAGAALCKSVMDSLLQAEPNAKVFIMGDLNDDPVSPSMKKVLKAQKDAKKVKTGGFFNPMYEFYIKGNGTLAYNDAWSLFDQIVVSKGLLNEKDAGFRYYKADIFKARYLFQKTGQFKGYPFRTFAGNVYQGGYSDHLPVFVTLIKKK